ncbi:MAG: FKBP-type peptidyl-prolyl cis-trans isomerase [Candidatus Paceibacterota bacterium]|jgi:peptidylprolyl isomerase
MQKNKGTMIVWVLIVLVVVVALVFITINAKKNPSLSQNSGGETLKMGETKQIEGVKLTVLREGSGDIAKNGDIVAMNYTGTLSDGTAFDSNTDPKFQHVMPFEFTVGAGQVIKGWDVGIAGMKVGEQRKLEINPDFAYGATGIGGVIPPNATLTFEVELLGIKTQ